MVYKTGLAALDMRKHLLFIGAFIVGFVLFAFSLKFYSWRELLQLLVNIDWWLILAYLGVSFAIFLTIAARWKVVCNQHKIKVPFWNLLAYRYVGFAVSFITPGPRIGGEPVRAGLLMRHKADYPTALSSVVADKTIELTTFGVLFLICLGSLLFAVPLSLTNVIIFGATGFIIFGILIFVFWAFMTGRDPVLTIFRTFRLDRIKFLRKYEDEVIAFEKNITGFYKRDTKVFVIASILSTFAWCLSFVEYKLLLLMLGLDVGIIPIFAIYSVVGFAYLIPIPFALGTLEAAQTGVFAALKLPTEAGAAVAFITRGRDMMRTLIGFIILGFLGVDVARVKKKDEA